MEFVYRQMGNLLLLAIRPDDFQGEAGRFSQADMKGFRMDRQIPVGAVYLPPKLPSVGQGQYHLRAYDIPVDAFQAGI